MGLLEKLVDASGISGNEGAVRNLIIKEARKYIKDIKVDSMGNVVVRKKGLRPAVMFTAHMDEVGLMVSAIKENGQILFSEIGGIDPPTLLGQRVYLIGKKEKVQGVITTFNTSNARDIEKNIKLEHLYIDCGIDGKELKKLGVGVGSYVQFTESSNCTTLGNKDIISATALDDRIGCYILLELIKNLKTKNEVYFVFTVQEEIGLYGAQASVFHLSPDYAIAVDVTGSDKDERDIDVGKGPVLMIKDAEMISNRCLSDALEEAAMKTKVEIQKEVSELGTTDAASIFVAKGGIPSGVIGVAVRNLHTPIGIAHLGDIEGCIKLLREFLRRPPTKCWA